MRLTLDNAISFLRERGWIEPDEPTQVRELTGGVSNLVLLVESDRQRFVVKQALPQLRVRDEWLCPVDRIWVEQRAIETLSQLVGNVRLPAVLYADRDNYTFAMTAAPAGALNWKAELLAGRIDPALGAAAGELLGQIHSRGRQAAGVAEAFADDRFFQDLRVDPYYRTTAARHPDLSGPILAQVERMQAPEHRLALVHGDYSPKNMLITGGDLLLLDFEVAHWGDPTFDLAFCLNHVFLKSIHRPQWRTAYFELAGHFWAAYERTLDLMPAALLLPTTLKQLGCLMLARVDGKSPVEYLTDEGRRAVVRRAARALILGEATTLAAAMDVVDAADPRPAQTDPGAPAQDAG